MDDQNVRDFCINCCIPFSPSNPWEEEREKVYEISYVPSSSSSSKDILGSNKIINFDSPLPVSTEKKVTVHKVLGSTFKFEFLKILSTSSSSSEEEEVVVGRKQKDDDEYDEENLPLCRNCAQILTNLYKSYNEFRHRGAFNSYVNKKINRLHDIIHHHHHHHEKEDHHQDDILNYDLHTPGPVSSSTIEKNSVTTTATTRKSASTSIDIETQTPPVVAIVFVDQPKIVVDRVQDQNSRDNDHPRKRSRMSSSQVKYVEHIISDSESVDTNCSDGIDSFALKTNYDYYDDEDDEDQPINYLDIDIKVEDQEWTEPQVQRRHKVSKKSTAKKAKAIATTTTKPRKSPAERKARKHHIVSGEKRKRGRRKLSPSEKKKKHGKKDDLRDYLSMRAKYVAPCWYCTSRDFATPSDCFDHTTKEHLPTFQVKSPGSMVCDRCSRICINSQTMGLHRKRCDDIPTGEIIPKAFFCTVESCGKSFAFKKYLKTHMTVHSEDRPFACDQPECGYRSKTMSAMSIHKAYQHPAGGSVDLLKLQCDECGTWVKNNNSLKSHKSNMHTPEGLRKYNEYKQSLSAKKKEETREKKATATSFCLDCNVDLFTPYGLTMHKKQFHPHEIENTHQCEVCGQSFVSAASLKTHRKVHSDERPFICDQCGKGFKLNHHLKDHVAQVHTEEGRLKYNERIRAKTRRRKLIARQIASGGVPSTTTTTTTTTIVKAAAGPPVNAMVPGLPWDMTLDQLHHVHGPPKF